MELGLNGRFTTPPGPKPADAPAKSSPPSAATDSSKSDSTERLRIVAARPSEAAGNGVSAPLRRGLAGDRRFGSEMRDELEDWNIARVGTRPSRLLSWSPIVSSADGLSYAAEQYRIVRTKIFQLLGKPFRLVITSPSIGDGKTLTAVNLATAMALKSEGRTLLIDADLRRANVHNCLGVPLGPGLAEVLACTCPLEEAIFAVADLPRLHILPAGQPRGNPSELLDSSRWRSLADFVREDFSQVIVDCPPVGVVTDYDLIAAVCDGVALVVRPDHTDRTLCFSAIAKLGPKMTGVLLNDTPEWFFWKKPVHSGYYYYRRDGNNSPRDKRRSE